MEGGTYAIFFKLFFHLEIKLKYYYLLIFDLSLIYLCQC